MMIVVCWWYCSSSIPSPTPEEHKLLSNTPHLFEAGMQFTTNKYLNQTCSREPLLCLCGGENWIDDLFQ